MKLNTSKRIYLDYAATTPVDPQVKKAMESFWDKDFGNPSSLYDSGIKAKQFLEQARKTIAGFIKAKPKEIIFTAGGSESLNLAILGIAGMNLNEKSGEQVKFKHFITTAIEHHCVLNCFDALKSRGHKTTIVSVDGSGLVDVQKIKQAITPQTVFISVMMVNNEIGTIEPIAEIGKMLKHLNLERLANALPKVLFHTDACQAAGYLDLNVDLLGIDLLTLNGSKIYGPKQTGILYVRDGIKLEPIIYGGGQERGLRGGTENVAGAVGLAKALELVRQKKEIETKRLRTLRDYLILQIKNTIPKVLLNGVDSLNLKNNDNKNKNFQADLRLCNNVNFSFLGLEGESLMVYLNAAGFEVSTASACSSQAINEPSHVLRAIGRSKNEATAAIRFTLGKNNTKADLVKLIKILPKLVNDLRQVKSL